jgi:DNA-directed RNA polymerase alpha subunit
MQTLYVIIIISFAVIIYILIYMMRKMAKLKEQNDRIYEDKANTLRTGYVRTIEDTAIEGIDMSVRLRNCLKKARFDDLEEVRLFTKQELVGIHGHYGHLGMQSLKELEALMNEHNLKFKDQDA